MAHARVRLLKAISVFLFVGYLSMGLTAAYSPWSLVSSDNLRNLLVDGDKLFALRDRRMAVSTDQGVHWNVASPILPDTVYPNYATWKSPYFYVEARNGGVFRAASGDTAWKPVNSGFPQDVDVLTVTVKSDQVLAGTNHGLYASLNNGDTWTSVSGTIPASVWVPQICVTESLLFLATNRGDSFRGASLGNGYTWTEQVMRFPKAVVAKGPFLFSASLGIPTDSGVFTLNRSEDAGLTWSPVVAGLPHGSGEHMVDLEVIGNSLFVGVEFSVDMAAGLNVVYRSDDDGVSWQPFATGIPNSAVLNSLSVIGNTLFALVHDRGLGTSSLWTVILPTASVSAHSGSNRRQPHTRLRPWSQYRVTGQYR
jgi:hypothetical protein